MIRVHVFDYLAIIIANIVVTYTPYSDSVSYEIAAICYIAVDTVCNVIFGLIIYHLGSKILAITAHSTKPVAQSLIEAEAPKEDHVNVYQARLSITAE